MQRAQFCPETADRMGLFLAETFAAQQQRSNQSPEVDKGPPIPCARTSALANRRSVRSASCSAVLTAFPVGWPVSP